MAIAQWHYGKIVLLWAWGIVAALLLIRVISGTADFVPGFALVGTLLAVPFALSVITWKWLSGKEQ